MPAEDIKEILHIYTEGGCIYIYMHIYTASPVPFKTGR